MSTNDERPLHPSDRPSRLVVARLWPDCLRHVREPLRLRRDGHGHPASHVAAQRKSSHGAVFGFDEVAAKATSLLFGSFGDGSVSMEVLIDTSNPDEHVVHYEAAFVD